MSKINNADRPAMPFQEVTGMVGGVPTGYKNHVGLTKREKFAMAAMQGILNNGIYTFADCAKDAVQYADALLAELERTK
jgi:hypothetical protein